ncbi:MAG: lysophospholipid acyltransferase family protein [bacterium]|nr:lysophospholipid acyltransferase family protein [bacterium]
MARRGLLLQRFLKPAFRVLFRVVARVRTEGIGRLPARPPFIIFSNHISWFDPVIIAAFMPVPVHIMAMEGLFAFPPLGLLIRRLGGFPVSRGALDRHAIEEAMAVLTDGGVILIFPEGGIGRLGKGERPRGGISLIAERTGVPLVPLGISGCRGLYRFWRFPVRRPEIDIRLGEPFLVSSLSRMPGKKTRQVTMERIARELRALAGDAP